MEFLKDDPSNVWKYKDVIFSKTSIVDIAHEYGMQLEKKESGEVTHRARCPFHKGKTGSIERTPSFFIYGHTNSFCCFGCGKTGNVLDFISLMDGTPHAIALMKLGKKVGLIDKDGKWDEINVDAADGMPRFDPMKTIEPFLFEISVALRSYIKMFIGSSEFDAEFRWMEKVASKVDGFVSNIGYEDWEYAQDLCEKVKASVKSRIKKKGR